MHREKNVLIYIFWCFVARPAKLPNTCFHSQPQDMSFRRPNKWGRKINTPKAHTSDLLLNLQYLMTSGADHLTGNLEHWELVYWSSRTNLRSGEWTHTIIQQHVWADVANTAIKKIRWRVCRLWNTYLVIPKSDTFTSLFFETRQFLAACRRKG